MNKPIAFFDIESTGTSVYEDRIVEISIVKYNPDNPGVRKVWTSKLNPQILIPKKASEVHGIYDEDVKDAPTFKEVAPKIREFMEGCDIGGFNSNRFDIPMLCWEYFRWGLKYGWLAEADFIDVGNIFKRQEERTLSAAVKKFLGKEHEDAHGAEADTIATLEVFLAMQKKYELPEDRKELSQYCNFDYPRADIDGKFYIDEDGDYCYNFGKSRGIKCKLDPDFAYWMLDKHFLPDTLRIAEEIWETYR